MKQDTQASFRAWIIFSPKADVQWLRLLKPRFRHCALLINDGQSWIMVDPMLHHAEISVQHNISSSFDLPSWYQKRDHIVIKAPIFRHHQKPAALMPISCVEVIKRILGYHKLFVLTPWQLYRYVQKISRDIDQKEKSIIHKGDLSWEV